MNSSVTCDSATSVTSSWCLAMRPRSRSKGPSKTSRWTWNAAGPPVPGSSTDVMRSATGREPNERADNVVEHGRHQGLRTAEWEQQEHEHRHQTDVLLDEVVLSLLPAGCSGGEPEQQPATVQR